RQAQRSYPERYSQQTEICAFIFAAYIGNYGIGGPVNDAPGQSKNKDRALKPSFGWRIGDPGKTCRQQQAGAYQQNLISIPVAYRTKKKRPGKQPGGKYGKQSARLQFI